MAGESISSMEVPEPVDDARRERTFGWASLVRVVARVPLPIRAKQLVGTIAVAALLALVAVLGLVALGQSNSRGAELRRLKQQGGYEQLLLTDATQLKQLLDFRLNTAGISNLRPDRSDETSLRHYDPDSYERGFLSALDQQIGNEWTRLCFDAGDAKQTEFRDTIGGGTYHCTSPSAAPHLPLTLHSVAPALSTKIADSMQLLVAVAGASGLPQDRFPHPADRLQGDHWAGSVRAELAALTAKTQARADALVAADRSSYNRSRDLLIGAGAGSLLLALALGLLFSDSVVVPLQKTQRRLASIAAGDFAGHVEVPNRDEIGALAADVNRMSDELQRVYGELEKASRHKSDFLATMSHELRTPLNAIIGFSEVLQEQMFGELNERQLAYIDEVLRAGEHLLSLINDVLDLAKIEAGKMELELSEVAISEVLRSAVAMHAERASRGGIDLAMTAEPEEITVAADERRVRQVLFNLVSNAIKFTPEGGRVDISVRVDGGYVVIAVADTGPGIPAGELETIFEEFEQSSDGKNVEGTGLGLPLSRRLVELHGGRLWVESEVGRGSTFRFNLPVGPAERLVQGLASGNNSESVRNKR
jgi:signal transduction histidine kinase